MDRREKNNEKIGKILAIILIIVLIWILVYVYKRNNYNEYIRAEYVLGLSKFTRDGEEKYSQDTYSYKIENTEFNDAMFYKTIKVTPNTPYKVTCMVKTKDVLLEKQNIDAGAHICIGDTVEKSNNVVGTTEWTKLEFLFDSKDRTQVDVGFRLGGYEGNCTGTAWFSDMKIEAGIADGNNDWQFLCLVFNNIDVNLEMNGTTENIKLSLNYDNIYDIRSSFERFEASIKELSKGKINAEGTLIEIEEPLRSMTYDEENEYYISSHDINYILDDYINEGKYDHIFVVFKSGDTSKNKEIPINDWIGLGAMEYRNLGFSNIRFPSDDNNYIYKYDSRINTFPEEVFVHEFLHSLERDAEEYGYERPELHDYEKYNYVSKPLVGLKQWYADYMNCEIETLNGNIGLPSEIFYKRPVKPSYFEYSHKLDVLNEPENIIEELHNFVFRLINMFKLSSNNTTES